MDRYEPVIEYAPAPDPSSSPDVRLIVFRTLAALLGVPLFLGGVAALVVAAAILIGAFCPPGPAVSQTVGVGVIFVLAGFMASWVGFASLGFAFRRDADKKASSSPPAVDDIWMRGPSHGRETNAGRAPPAD